MREEASIELAALALPADIGTYGPGDVVPRAHLRDLTLAIDARDVLIDVDEMDAVFDYDPLIAEIDALARDGHYETQERLMTRIREACARHAEIEAVSMVLRKIPVRAESGSLGVRLTVDRVQFDAFRRSLSP